MNAAQPEGFRCRCATCTDDPRAESVRDLWTEAARDNAIRGQIEDAYRADMTDRRRTEDY